MGVPHIWLLSQTRIASYLAKSMFSNQTKKCIGGWERRVARVRNQYGKVPQVRCCQGNQGETLRMTDIASCNIIYTQPMVQMIKGKLIQIVSSSVFLPSTKFINKIYMIIITL